MVMDGKETANSCLQSSAAVLLGGDEKMKPEDTVFLLEDVVWRGKDIAGMAAGKQIALTFNDGPDGYWTEKILDVLGKYEIKATFFCLGQQAADYPQGLRRIVEAGHAVGNMTWDHPHLTEISPEEIRRQIVDTTTVIEACSGISPRMFRSPFGDLNRLVVREIASLQKEIVQWSVNGMDYLGWTGLEVLGGIMPHVHGGAIVLLHAAAFVHNRSLAGTIDALPTIIEILSLEGYQFVTLPILLGCLPEKNKLDGMLFYD